MIFLSLFLLAVSVIYCDAGVVQRIDSRIVNGEDAFLGEIPYQVSIQATPLNRHFCGGSILNENYVITAAHCVTTGSGKYIRVVAGTVDLRSFGSAHNVSKIIRHAEFNPRTSANDIALLKVETPFAMDENINVVNLPSMSDTVHANDLAVVSGWGTLWENGLVSDTLKRVDIFIADHSYCKKAYFNFEFPISDSHVCAHDPNKRKGSCHGDSGGPLTVNGTLVGLVSWAKGCARTDYPTVYTRVSSYLDWINQHAV